MRVSPLDYAVAALIALIGNLAQFGRAMADAMMNVHDQDRYWPVILSAAKNLGLPTGDSSLRSE